MALPEGSQKPVERLFSPECGPQRGEDVRQRFFSLLRVLPGRIPPLIVPPSFLWVPASIPTAPQSWDHQGYMSTAALSSFQCVLWWCRDLSTPWWSGIPGLGPSAPGRNLRAVPWKRDVPQRWLKNTLEWEEEKPASSGDGGLWGGFNSLPRCQDTWGP